MSEPTSNPAYNNAHGAAIQSGSPPFDLENVIMRVFPLRASYNSLQLFCDRYLNIAPGFAWFEPAAPFIILGVINYGRMGRSGSNYGYTSQNEVIFAVPLNWYRVEGGRRVFSGQTSISPFIWVDEPSSTWTGREVYGWAKNLAWLTPGVDAWMKDPRSRRTLFALSANVFRQLFAGQRQVPELLVEIEEEQPEALLEVPPDPFNALNPLIAWPKAALNAMRAAGSMLEAVARLPMLGYPKPDQRASIREMIVQAFGNFNIFGQLPPGNTINLKQFRDPQRPEQIAYQALINSAMTTTSFNRGGLLGEPGLQRGDLSGGYRVRIHRYPGWPIIESLGLEVAGETFEEGRSVAMLEPILPFWVDVDFEYGAGEVLCYRTLRTHWTLPPSSQTPAPEPDPALTSVGRAQDPAVLPECVCDSPHLYNTAEGGAIEQVYGPFHFPNVTIRVLPLLADWDTLRGFCDQYLNNGRTTEFDAEGHPVLADKEPADALAEHLFVPWGSYVYMIVTNFEEVTSEVNIGWWARRRVAFSFPVRWYKRGHERDDQGNDVGEETWGLKSLGLVSPFMYVDTGPAATTGREMQGWPVAEAEIVSPRHHWLHDRGPVCPPDLLELSTNVTPALNADQKMRKGLLLQVTGRDPLDETEWNGWKEVAAEWGEDLVVETRKKAEWSSQAPEDPANPNGWTPYMRLQWLKSSGLEILVNGAPINHISLKQFRDAEDPTRACYQAINLYPETLQRVHDLREIDHRLHVAVHRYPTQPIVEALGLRVKWTDATQGQAIDYLQPIRPFWLRANMAADLGQDVLWRSGSEEWREGETPNLYFDFDQFEEWSPPADSATWGDLHPRALQDFRSDKTRDKVESLARARWSGEWWKRRSEHRKALSEPSLTFAPQVALESALSKRWLNFERPEPPEGSREEPTGHPDSIVRKDTIGHPVVRAKFERDYGLDPSDPDHWIFPPDQEESDPEG